MLIRVGNARTGKIDLALAGIMSFVAGAINAVGFLIAGAFSANMTGNVSALADELAAGNLVMALSFLGLFVAFVAGAAFAAFGIQAGERYGIRSVYSLAILFEAALLFALGMSDLFDSRITGHEMLIITLCFVMGLQNAVTTMISQARVRTTHVSGMATDLGIGLATLLGDKAAKSEAVPKLKLHALTLTCFAAGGVLGALVYSIAGHWVFIVGAAVLLMVAGPEAWLARRKGQ
ncbi:DUF1275 domain-containing protein [Xinfangfangia sp. D13-10-4-6]|nr:DUF1275 domain-containing protein [Pseudogemmobacter hezensis]